MYLINRFRRSSIRARLAGLVVFNGGVALLLVGAFLLGYQKFELRRTAVRELLTQAGIVAENSTAALSFSDERAATGSLKALRRDPKFVRAAVYDAHGRLFASYARSAGPDGGAGALILPENPLGDEIYLKNGDLFVSQPVMLGGERLGTVCLEADMGEVESRLRTYTGIVCLALLASLLLALAVSARMQRAITRPLAVLSGVAATVSAKKDYSVRVPVPGMGEVGVLIDSFNEMLTQIEFHENARRSAEQCLRESEERFALAARGANDGLWDWKRSTGLTYLSPRGNQMLGYPETERWWDLEDWGALIHPSDRDRVLEDWNAMIRDSRDELISEYRLRRRDNSSIWVLSRGRAVKDAEGNVVRIAGSLTDITEGKVADHLTGLRSRFYFLDRLENAIEDAALSEIPFSVLFLDLDRFKLVNDSLGHAAGDELLMEVATRLRFSFAGSALSPVIARLGGDEFAILASNTGRREAVEIADRVLRNIAAPLRLCNQQMYPGVSIGVALHSSATTPEDLLRNADTAMYHAKKGGRGRVEIFDEAMRDRVRARLEIETELRGAIDHGHLVLDYQPQMLLNGRRLSGFEALVRWQHPQRGLIQPAEFISVAEETGLIVPLGRWVLREACTQMTQWQRKFTSSAPVTIAVNVSYQQLRETGFVEDVERILAETGLPPESLRLEMTESTIMASPDETAATLQRLKDLRIGLEIDDFGTGYSSLSCLNRLPFDTVKIDRTFIRDLGDKAEGSEIVRAILELARSMAMTVVAEGVETSQQLEELSVLGCSHAQGYLFWSPMSPKDASLLFEEEAMRYGFRRTQSSEEEEYAAA